MTFVCKKKELCCSPFDVHGVFSPEMGAFNTEQHTELSLSHKLHNATGQKCSCT